MWNMAVYECPECGYGVESKKQEYCNRDHRKAAMYRVMNFGKGGVPNWLKEKLATEKIAKNTPSK